MVPDGPKERAGPTGVAHRGPFELEFLRQGGLDFGNHRLPRVVALLGRGAIQNLLRIDPGNTWVSAPVHGALFTVGVLGYSGPPHDVVKHVVNDAGSGNRRYHDNNEDQREDPPSTVAAQLEL